MNCYNCLNIFSKPYAIENGYRCVKCSNCGLIFLNPRPTDEDIITSHRIGEHKGEKVISVIGKHKKRKIKKYLKIFSKKMNY